MKRRWTCPQCGEFRESEQLPESWLILRKSILAGKSTILQSQGTFDRVECLEGMLQDRRDSERREREAA